MDNHCTLTALLGHTQQTCMLWTNECNIAGESWYTPFSGPGPILPADPIGVLLEGTKGVQMTWDAASQRYWPLEVHPDLLRCSVIEAIAQLSSEIISLTGLRYLPPETVHSPSAGGSTFEEPDPAAPAVDEAIDPTSSMIRQETLRLLTSSDAVNDAVTPLLLDKDWVKFDSQRRISLALLLPVATAQLEFCAYTDPVFPQLRNLWPLTCSAQWP
jgi:hypothetical protein